MGKALEELTRHTGAVSSRQGTINQQIGHIRFQLSLMETETETARTLDDQARIEAAKDMMKTLSEKIDGLETQRSALDDTGIRLAQASIKELIQENEEAIEEYSELLHQIEILQKALSESLNKLGIAHRKTASAQITYQRFIAPNLPEGTPAPFFPSIILPDDQYLSFPLENVQRALRGSAATPLEVMRKKHDNFRDEAIRSGLSEARRERVYLAEQASIKAAVEAKEAPKED